MEPLSDLFIQAACISICALLAGLLFPSGLALVTARSQLRERAELEAREDAKRGYFHRPKKVKWCDVIRECFVPCPECG